MTKTEKIMVANQNFRDRRGRSVADQTEMYLRRIRRERNPEDDWGAFAIRVPGWGAFYYATFRKALIAAKREAMRNDRAYGRHYGVDVFDTTTDILLRTV